MLLLLLLGVRDAMIVFLLGLPAPRSPHPTIAQRGLKSTSPLPSSRSSRDGGTGEGGPPVRQLKGGE